MAFSGISVAMGLTGAATLKQIFRIKITLNLCCLFCPHCCAMLFIQHTRKRVPPLPNLGTAERESYICHSNLLIFVKVFRGFLGGVRPQIILMAFLEPQSATLSKTVSSNSSYFRNGRTLKMAFLGSRSRLLLLPTRPPRLFLPFHLS